MGLKCVTSRKGVYLLAILVGTLYQPPERSKMTTTSKRQMPTLVLWAIVWALALIASAIFFKGNPIKDWVQSALFIGAITFWLWQYRRRVHPHC